MREKHLKIQGTTKEKTLLLLLFCFVFVTKLNERQRGRREKQHQKETITGISPRERVSYRSIQKSEERLGSIEKKVHARTKKTQHTREPRYEVMYRMHLSSTDIEQF